MFPCIAVPYVNDARDDINPNSELTNRAYEEYVIKDNNDTINFPGYLVNGRLCKWSANEIQILGKHHICMMFTACLIICVLLMSANEALRTDKVIVRSTESILSITHLNYELETFECGW